MGNNIAVFDIDGTIVDGQTQLIFAKYLFQRGLISKSFMLKVLFWFILYKLGIMKDVETITKKSFRFFNGYKIDYVNELMHDCFENNIKPMIFRKALKEIDDIRGLGYKIIFISNTLQGFVDQFVNFFNAYVGVGTKLNESSGVLTGSVNGSLVYGNQKVIVLKDIIKFNDLKPSVIRCYADHYSDFQILSYCSCPIVVNPDTKLKNYAKNKNWEIKNF